MNKSICLPPEVFWFVFVFFYYSLIDKCRHPIKIIATFCIHLLGVCYFGNFIIKVQNKQYHLKKLKQNKVGDYYTLKNFHIDFYK